MYTKGYLQLYDLIRNTGEETVNELRYLKQWFPLESNSDNSRYSAIFTSI